jgi:hypothetical protein
MIVPCLWESVPWCLGWMVEKLAFPLAIAYVIYWLALRQLKRKRQLDYADKQLTEFYAPMMGARAEIFNDKVFDTHLYRAAAFVDMEYAKVDGEGAGIGRRAVEKLSSSRYEGRVEAYVEMRKLFADKMAFADRDTREWYAYFHAFVEMLRRHEVKHGPNDETVAALASMFEEKPLEPFYRHLEERTDDIQREIRGLRVLKRRPAEPPPKVGEPWLFLPSRS